MSEKALKDGRLKIRLDCTCGSAIETVGSDHDYVQQLAWWFENQHVGEGHRMCTVEEGQRARRRNQRQRMSAWRKEAWSDDA